MLGRGWVEIASLPLSQTEVSSQLGGGASGLER